MTVVGDTVPSCKRSAGATVWLGGDYVFHGQSVDSLQKVSCKLSTGSIVTGVEVIEKAIAALTAANEKSRNHLLNNVRASQITQLSSSLIGVTPETNLQVWESWNGYNLVLARAVLSDLIPGWNRKDIPRIPSP